MSDDANGGTPPFVVFDLDGTLIDSRRDLADATNALIAECGGEPLPEETVAAMVGDGAAMLVRRALKAARLERAELPAALERFLAHYAGRLTNHTRPYPGIPEALAALKARGALLAVLTNKPANLSLEILDRLGLARDFLAVVGGDSAVGRKPDPAGLLGLMREAGAAEASTVLVGDSPVDFETARRANVRICLARYGFGYRFPDGVLRGDELAVDAPAELPIKLKVKS